jgi:parallel beta-helix repeat protein
MKKLVYSMTVVFLILVMSSIAFAQSRGTVISSLPYSISREGVYYLSRNLEEKEKNEGGITVEIDNVTIDLSGYALIGLGTATVASSTSYGIYMNGRSNVEIKNGTIRNFGLHGIYEANNVGHSHRAINVRAINNGGLGIYLAGNNHLVKDSTIANNGSHGLNIGTGSLVISNTSFNNGGSGFYITTGCSIRDNTASLNQQYGIYLGGNNLVDGNTAFLNNLSGGGFSNFSPCPSCTFGSNQAP